MSEAEDSQIEITLVSKWMQTIANCLLFTIQAHKK
jgi:hypothetical protein